MTIPARVADNVPKGMDLRGFFKSPERPTPAVMPANAGKIIANTTKNLSGFCTLANMSKPAEPELVLELPIKNINNDKAKVVTTTQSTVTPNSAPLVIMRTSRRTVAGML